MPWDDDLEGSARNIAAYEGRYLRVKAGPGTGKTYSLIRRIARLLEEGVDPSTILAVTFTKTAAKDLVSQLNQLGSPGSQNVNASTLHSLAFKLLTNRSVFESIGRIPRPLLEYEKDCMISDLAKKFEGKKKVKTLIKEFEAYWAVLQHLTPGWPPDPEKQRFQTELRSWLVEHEAILIDELVPLAIEYIRNNPSSVHSFQYTHVLVDEYQDLNRADQEFIESLARNGSLSIIGDDDQSIYGFRYAHPEGILTFDSSHPETHDEELLDCRRCPKKIVSMATSLIAHNSSKTTPLIRMVPSNCEGNVFVVQHDTVAQEVENISSFIKWYLDTNTGTIPKDILVLSTRRKIGYSIRDQLLSLEIPAKSYFLEESLEKLSSKEGFCLLTLLVKPSDKVALRTWLCIDKPNSRVTQYEHILEVANGLDISLYDFLQLITEKKAASPPYTSELIGRFLELQTKITQCNILKIPELIDFLWPPGNLDCEEIRGMALSISPIVENPEGLLNELIQIITHPEVGEADDFIRIMSLHKSKGLTAKCVIVTGCVSGALPTIERNLTQPQLKKKIEEQRRLFYVAITRTTETLVISSAAAALFGEAMQMGLTIAQSRGIVAILQNSPFITELGNGDLRVISGRQWCEDLGL